MSGAADQRQQSSVVAALVIRQVAVIVIRENHARGEVGDDAAFRAFEDRAVRNAATRPCSSAAEFGFRPPWYQTSVTGPRQLFAGCSKLAFNLTGQMSGLYLSLTSWSISIDDGRAGIDRVPDQVHRVGAHVAHLADAEVAVHVPEQAVQAVRSAEVLRAVGMVGRRSDPLLVVQERGRLAFAGGIAGARQLAAVPAVNGLQLADGAIEDQLAQAFEVRIGVALRAVLRRDFALALEVIRADGARLLPP